MPNFTRLRHLAAWALQTFGPARQRARGFTVIELLVTCAILAVIGAIAWPTYGAYRNRADSSKAVDDISALSLKIDAFYIDTGAYPASLSQVGGDTLRDPYGRPYQYLNLQTSPPGLARKDHSLVPINTDYDLYSMGKDGESVGPLTAAASRDDIIRANNGRFIGGAWDY